MRLLIIAGFVGATCALALSAVAAGPADDAVTARQTALKSMGKTFKEIHTISAGDINAQRATLVADAHLLKTLAPQPWSHFGPETANTTVKNEALPVIWTDAPGFHAAQAKLIAAVDGLDAVAATGAPDVVAAKAGEVGAACGGCHKVFKAK